MTPNPTSTPKPAIAYACVRCFDRKVKCSRDYPNCSACIKHGQPCEYRTPAKPQRKKRRIQDTLLTQRLKHYETLLQQNGIDVSSTEDSNANIKRNDEDEDDERETPGDTASLVPSSTTDTTRQFLTSQLVFNQGRSQYLDNNLWTRVTEELSSPQDALGESSEDETIDDNALDNNMDYFVAGASPSMPAIIAHPPADQIMSLWHTFLEHVNPLCKLVHRPTLHVTIEKAVTHIQEIPKNLEALMFAIYAAAIESITEQECESQYGEQRHVLLSRYRNGTKISLARAKFLRTTDIVVLQALVLHLMTTRNAYESRTLWTLVGVAIRIGEGMGLHRDGSVLGLPPFEAEIRRRIWWQVTLLDIRSAELAGSNKFKNTTVDQPQIPTNVDDEDLYPGMKDRPGPKEGITDMIFCALRHEFASFWTKKITEGRQKGSSTGNFLENYTSPAVIVEKDKDIDELRGLMETKYVRYCDPTIPLQLMCMLVARASLNSMRLMIHHPRRYAKDEDIPEAEKVLLWTLSIRVLETDSMCLTDRKLRRFAWHTKFYFQWHALIHVLDCLKEEPLRPEADQAWELMGETFENHADFITNTKKPVHVAVGTLCLRAYNAREHALSEKGRSLPRTTPDYIILLRKQRDKATAKLKAHEDQRQLERSMQQVNVMPGVNATPQLQDSNPSIQSFQQPANSFWYEDLGFQQTNSINMDYMMAQDSTMTGAPMDWMAWDNILRDLGPG